MGSLELITKLTNSGDPRSLYEVPVGITFDELDLDELALDAVQQNVVNQLGVILDITLNGLLPTQHSRYSKVTSLREKLYSLRSHTTQPFYKDENPRLVSVKEERLAQLNSSSMTKILKDWDVVCVLSPEKFKEVYQREYESRQGNTN